MISVDATYISTDLPPAELTRSQALGKLNPPIQFFQATAPWHLTWLSWFPLLWHAGYHHIHGSPVYWRHDKGALVYVWGEEDNLRAYPYDPQNQGHYRGVVPVCRHGRQ